MDDAGRAEIGRLAGEPWIPREEERGFAPRRTHEDSTGLPEPRIGAGQSVDPSILQRPVAVPEPGPEIAAEAEAEGEQQERSALAEIARLLPYARMHLRLFGVTLLASVALAVADIPIPFFLKRVIDSVLHDKHPVAFFGVTFSAHGFLFVLFLGLLALAAFKGSLIYLHRMASETLGQKMVYALRLDLYRHLQSLSMGFFRAARTGKIMLRFMGDVSAVLDMITDGFLRALMDSVTILAVLVVIFALHWQLALAVLAVLPVYCIAFLVLSPALRRTGRMARHERSAFSGNLQEKIAGAAVVKAFNRQQAEETLVMQQTGRMTGWLIEKARVGGLLSAIATATVAVGGALVLWMGGNAVLNGTLSKGGLMAFYSLLAMLFPPLRRLAKTNETYQAARVSLDRILDFLEETEPLKESGGAMEMKEVRGRITFEDIHFSYLPGTPVLRGIDIEILPGEVVALVGPNGAGKTTLASLLPRFLDPDRGRVQIDGQNIHDVSLASLRRQIGIVTQETFLFSGTIEENIRYGRPEASDSEIRRAAGVANALDFIEALPTGFQTQVGERGQRLSGGQIQRIALARAILSDPPILLLDEATSAVDAESEALIRQALGRLMVGRTTIVIAHRLSTVRRADRIIVILGGKIVGEGHHDSLYGRNAFYTRICDEQLFQKETS